MRTHAFAISAAKISYLTSHAFELFQESRKTTKHEVFWYNVWKRLVLP